MARGVVVVSRIRRRSRGADGTDVNIVIAIDGPSGSGKSTVARGVAVALGLKVLDTGAMYRAVTLAALETGTPLDDGIACAKLAATHDIKVEAGVTTLDGRDVSAEIRGPEVTQAVSIIAAHPALRAVLVAQQRAWVAAHGGGVVEGRDIGTVVFPDAVLKVFLTAHDDVRAARRRGDELAAARPVDVATVKESLERRDAIDSGRAASPLMQAEDALAIDTSNSDADTVVAELVRTLRERGIS
jgi:cytidylate kinase